MEPNIAQIAALIGDPSRANMLVALMGGKALTATELALEAEITSQTASSHLSKMVDKNLLTVQRQGRHKYFQLKGKEVADVIEALFNISSQTNHTSVFTGPRNPELRKARTCYDHLAEELGVSLYQTLIKNNLIDYASGNLIITKKGLTFFEKRGLDTNELQKKKRPLCKACLDWSERQNHLAGSLGKWILLDIVRKQWAQKDLDSRVLRFTTRGLKNFKKVYGI